LNLPRPLKVGILTTDNRDHWRKYDLPNPAFGTAIQSLLQGFCHFQDQVEIHIVCCTRKPVLSPLKLSENIFYHNIVVPRIGWLRTGYLGCIAAVRKKLKTIKPHLVHGQGTELDCAVEAVFSGYPNVVTIHGNMGQVRKALRMGVFSFHGLQSFFEKMSLFLTNGVFCNSKYTEDLVARFQRRTWAIPNALRLCFFDLPSARHPPSPPFLRLLVVGVVSPYKRQVEILRLLKDLRASGVSNWSVIFIGACAHDTSYGQTFLSLSGACQKEGWLEYQPPLSAEKLVASMDGADLLLHFPSEEAFGLVVPEALARGLKVFASKVGGICDITSGVPEAELFAPDDWDGLSKALTAWLQKPSLSSVQTQNLMKSRYHPKVIAARHLEIYRELIASR